MHLNVEIKARCTRLEQVRQLLQARSARFVGTDHQEDTYYRLPPGRGRLKLRQGNIERSLIHYQRQDQAGPKQSTVALYHPPADPALAEVLQAALGVLVVVDKKREIYFLENVKFHLDEVAGLGTFVEIEAIDKTGEIGAEKLQEQCEHYMALFEIGPNDLLETSYGDLLLAKRGQ